MTALKVLLVVLLLLFLLSLIRVGGEGEYGAEGVAVRVKIGPVKLQVFPLKKKDPQAQEEKKRRKEEKKKAKAEKKRAKEEKKRAKEAGQRAKEGQNKGAAAPSSTPQAGAEETASQPPEEKPKKKGGALDLVKAGLPLVGEAAGELRRKIRIDELSLDLVLGGRVDAARAAMAFGWANAIIGGILPVFENSFDVKERQIRTGMDFNAPGTTVWIRAAFSARIGQLVSFALRFGWKFFRRYQAQKKKAGTTKKGAN